MVTILKVIQAAQAPISVSKKVTTITDGNEEDERREKLLDNQDNKKKMLKKKLKVKNFNWTQHDICIYDLLEILGNVR